MSTLPRMNNRQVYSIREDSIPISSTTTTSKALNPNNHYQSIPIASTPPSSHFNHITDTNRKVLEPITNEQGSIRKKNSLRRFSNLIFNNSNSTNFSSTSSSTIKRSSSIQSNSSSLFRVNSKRISGPIIDLDELEPRLIKQFDQGKLIQLKSTGSSNSNLNQVKGDVRAQHTTSGMNNRVEEVIIELPTASKKALRILGLGDNKELARSTSTLIIGQAITSDELLLAPSTTTSSSTSSVRELEFEGEEILLNGTTLLENDVMHDFEDDISFSMKSINSIQEEEESAEKELDGEVFPFSPPTDDLNELNEEQVNEVEDEEQDQTLQFYTPKSSTNNFSYPSFPPPTIPLPALPLFPNSPTTSSFQGHQYHHRRGFSSSSIQSSNHSLTSPKVLSYSISKPLPAKPISVEQNTILPSLSIPKTATKEDIKKPEGLVRKLSRNLLQSSITSSSRNRSTSDLIAQQLSLASSTSTSATTANSSNLTQNIDVTRENNVRIALASVFIQSSLNPDPTNWIKSSSSSTSSTSIESTNSNGGDCHSKTKWKPEIINCVTSDRKNNDGVVLEILDELTLRSIQRQAVKLAFNQDIEIMTQQKRPSSNLSTFQFSIISEKFSSSYKVDEKKESIFFCVSLIVWSDSESQDSSNLRRNSDQTDNDTTTTRFWIPHALILVSKFPLYNILGDYLRLMWAKTSDLSKYSYLMKSVLNQVSAAEPSSKILVSVKTQEAITKTFFAAPMPSSIASTNSIKTQNFPFWPIFHALDAENVLTIIEVGLSSNARIIFVSDFSVMLGMAISVFEFILKSRGWKGIVHSSVHIRDLNLYLEDQSPWLIAIPFSSLSPILSSIASDILIVDLDHNSAEANILPPSQFTSSDRDKAVIRLERAIGRFNSSSRNQISFQVPDELKEAFVGGRFRPFSEVQIQSGKVKEADQLLPEWKFDSVHVMNELNSILTTPARTNSSFMSKLFGGKSLKSTTTLPIKSDSKVLKSQELLRIQVRDLINSRDILETEFWYHDRESNKARVNPIESNSRKTFSIRSDNSQSSQLLSEINALQLQRDLITQNFANLIEETNESIYNTVYSNLSIDNLNTNNTNLRADSVLSSSSNSRRISSSRSFHPDSAAGATEDFLLELLNQEQEREKAKLVKAVVGETLKSIQSRFSQVLEKDERLRHSNSSTCSSLSILAQSNNEVLTRPSLDSLIALEEKGLERNSGFIPKSFHLSTVSSSSSSPSRRSLYSSNTYKSHSRNSSTASLVVDSNKVLSSRPSMPTLKESTNDQESINESEGSREANRSVSVGGKYNDEQSERLKKGSVELFTRRSGIKKQKSLDWDKSY